MSLFNEKSVTINYRKKEVKYLAYHMIYTLFLPNISDYECNTTGEITSFDMDGVYINMLCVDGRCAAQARLFVQPVHTAKASTLVIRKSHKCVCIIGPLDDKNHFKQISHLAHRTDTMQRRHNNEAVGFFGAQEVGRRRQRRQRRLLWYVTLLLLPLLRPLLLMYGCRVSPEI